MLGIKWAYDIVIVSGSALGFEVAFHLSCWGRVALVIPEKTSWDGSWLRLILPERLGDRFEEHPRVLRGESLRRWLQGQVQRVQMIYSRAVLAAAGVDVIEGEGQFVQGKRLEFQVGGDRLKAPSYLLLDQPNWRSSLDTAYRQVLTPESGQPLGHWSVYGPGPELAEWVGLACLLEESVVWHLPGDRPLPQEDNWTNQRLQAYLEALGVKIYTHSESSLCQTPGIQYIGTEEAQPSKDVNLSESELQPPDSPGELNPNDSVTATGCDLLGLTGLDLRDPFSAQDDRLKVNGYLQTRHAKIYACGSWLKGYDLAMVTKAEALRIGHNCLRKKRRRPINYTEIPWWLTMPYPLARVGWNLHQLSPCPPEEASKTDRSVNTYPIQASPLGGDHGQILTNQKNEFLGATLAGYGAIPTSRIFALAMKKSLPWPEILAIAGWQLVD